MKQGIRQQGKTGASKKSTGGRTDFARLAAMTEEDIQRQIVENPDTVEFTDKMLDAAEWVMPVKKVPIALRVDPDVLDFFKAKGPGYQSRMHAVLQSFVAQARHLASRAPAPRGTAKTGKASAPKRSARRGEDR